MPKAERKSISVKKIHPEINDKIKKNLWNFKEFPWISKDLQDIQWLFCKDFFFNEAGFWQRIVSEFSRVFIRNHWSFFRWKICSILHFICLFIHKLKYFWPSQIECKSLCPIPIQTFVKRQNNVPVKWRGSCFRQNFFYHKSSSDCFALPENYRIKAKQNKNNKLFPNHNSCTFSTNSLIF